MNNNIAKLDRENISEGSMRFCLATISLSVGINNLKNTIAHNTRKNIKNKVIQE